MPTRLCAALVALAAFGGPATHAQSEGDASFRAFWADAFNVGFKSTSQINTMVSRAVAGRYNAIIVEVLAYHDTGASGHGAYWNSAYVPRASDISGNIDPLAVLCSTAHAAGIEVHAWIVSYRISNAWPPPGNSFLAARPHWVMVEQADAGAGPNTIGGHYTFDPGSPEVQQHLVNIARELITNYEIDGINLDYIRYLQTDAGYPADANTAQSSLARFRTLTGFVGTPPPTGNSQWNDFRRQTVSELVRRLRAEIPSITSNPRQPLRLTADLIVFGNAPGTFTASDAYVLHQDWRTWMERGWLDAGIPMNYKREHVSNEASWYRNWVNAAIGWSYDRHLFAGQGNYLNRKVNSVTQLAYSLNAGADGVVNYSYASTADENTNGQSEQDWAWYTYVSANLFTSTAPTPSMPWRDPAIATEGTLWGRVTDEQTGLPIDGATVQLGALPAVQTDGNGYYVVTLAPATAGGTTYALGAVSPACDFENQPDVVVLPGDVVRRDIDLCDAPAPPPIGDFDGDGDVDGTDMLVFDFCMQGPDVVYEPGQFCLAGDEDEDRDLDLRDMAAFQQVFGFTP